MIVGKEGEGKYMQRLLGVIDKRTDAVMSWLCGLEIERVCALYGSCSGTFLAEGMQAMQLSSAQ